MNEPAHKYVRPNDDVFETPPIDSSQIIPEGTLTHILVDVKYPPEGGIYAYYDGVLFPRKSMPYPQAVWANDVAKRITMFLINTAAKKVFMIPLSLLIFLPWKKKIATLEMVLGHWNRITEYIMYPYFLKENRYCDICRELYDLIIRFLVNLGVSHYTADRASKIFVTLIQNDDAYRYRLEDIFGSITKPEIMQNPRQAMMKAVDTFGARESDRTVTVKFRNFARLGSLAFKIPKVKRAFRDAFEKTEYSKLCLDEADIYHTLIWPTYNFRGIPSAERIEIYKDYHTVSDCCAADIQTAEDGAEICLKCDKPCQLANNFPPVLQLVRKKK